jgi:hypothetical protein
MNSQMVEAPTKLIAIGMKISDLETFSHRGLQPVREHRDQQPDRHRARRHDDDPEQLLINASRSAGR